MRLTGYLVTVGTAHYDPKGEPRIFDSTGPGPERLESAIANRFMFTGRDYIKELGIYDYRNRFYHPGLNRFLQTDPIGLQIQGAKLTSGQKAFYSPGGAAPDAFSSSELNLYRYCHNDPVNNSDPLGLDVNINYYRTEDPLYKYAQNVNEPKSFTLAGHGSQRDSRLGEVLNPGFSPTALGNGASFSPSQTAAAIMSKSAFAQKSQILLLVCSSGATGSKAASGIAAATGKPVIAPDKMLWINKEGKYFAADPVMLNGKIIGPDISKPGQLIRYLPDGTSHVEKKYILSR